MTTARAAPALAAFLATLLLMPWAPGADRPFISTDAAVADQRELEIELGYFTLEQSKGENTFRIPSLVLNYGVWKNTEIVGEEESDRRHRCGGCGALPEGRAEGGSSPREARCSRVLFINAALKRRGTE